MSVDQRFLYLVQRKSLFRDLLRDHKLDGFLLTNMADQYYFTDYWTEGYYGLIGLEKAWLFLPNLLFNQGKSNTYGFECVQGPFFEKLKGVLKKNKMRKVAFDPNQLPHSFGMALLKLGFLPQVGLVTQLRAVKDKLEIDRLAKANHIAYLGSEFVRKRLKPGVTERRIAADLTHFFNTKAHGLAFDLIIAAGPNGAFPHHITSNTKLKNGDPVVCDIGATWEGYRSDLTRTFALGKMKPTFRRVFRIVERSQNEGIKQLRPGVTAGSVDLASRRVIQKSGFGKTFVHSTGHGVGIDIHEHPRIGPGAKDKLKAGMVVTVEPGIYLPGKFGVRIEDTLLVTPAGSERLTK